MRILIELQLEKGLHQHVHNLHILDDLTVHPNVDIVVSDSVLPLGISIEADSHLHSNELDARLKRSVE